MSAPGRALLAAAVVAVGCAAGEAPPAGPQLVATVRQFGPVAYRDPTGAIAPDGRHFATAANHLLRLHSLKGDSTRVLDAGLARILHLTWSPDGRLLTEQRDAGGPGWWLHDPDESARRPLWRTATTFRSGDDSVDADRLRELAWSADGHRLAGIERRGNGSALWIVDTAGAEAAVTISEAQLSYPVWLRDGRIACLAMAGDRQRVTLPCGGTSPPGLDTLEAFGPMAVSPNGSTLYLAVPGDSGFVDLWSWPLAGGGGGERLARFGRDSYGPSVSADGTVFFRVQDYWTEVATIPAEGGAITRRTAFQAETPSWSPTGTSIGVTYGTWRRITDDFRYPDIAQDAGIIPAAGDVPATAPETIVEASVSEDQGLTWSPNMKWIALHSHQQESDDIWIRPADSPTPLRRISTLGRGAEVGWPRWSPDGRWIIFNGDVSAGGRRWSALWIIGIDQETGAVREPARPVDIAGLDEEVLHAEWFGGSEQIGFSHFESPNVHVLYRVPRGGGPATRIHRYTSTQRSDGFGAGADGAWLVFPAPDANGRLQLMRVESASGQVRQITSDSTDKTQPAVSPDGKTIAFTIWRYQAGFYTLVPPR